MQLGDAVVQMAHVERQHDHEKKQERYHSFAMSSSCFSHTSRASLSRLRVDGSTKFSKDLSWCNRSPASRRYAHSRRRWPIIFSVNALTCSDSSKRMGSPFQGVSQIRGSFLHSHRHNGVPHLGQTWLIVWL